MLFALFYVGADIDPAGHRKKLPVGLYYDAQGDAGLARGWIMMAAGLVAAALFGFAVLAWYDRKGLHRIPVETTSEKAAVPA